MNVCEDEKKKIQWGNIQEDEQWRCLFDYWAGCYRMTNFIKN